MLRELGELLVGRESTALLELIKNAYDADASQVTVEAVDLGKSGAVLRVVDDGNGMSRQRFESAFLRIASRVKEADDRRSPNYRRRYTGQKGIGRLAAHKLAAWLGVTSVPRIKDDQQRGEPDSVGVRAVLDWDLIEKQENLDDLAEGLNVVGLPSSPGVAHGTALELRRLRSSWTDRQLATFVTELRSAQPPRALTDPAWLSAAPASPPLIRHPIVRDTGHDRDPGFRVRLTGDLDIGDDLWQRAGDDFEWLLEIDATTEEVQYQITPLRRYAEAEPEAQTYRFQRRASLVGRPRFQARVLTMPNASTRRGPLSGFVRSTSGVRVYLEGFRVLPYGEYGDDWLGIDRDYRGGPRFYAIDIDAEASDQIEVDRKEGLVATGNTGYFGAVFLTEEGAGGLRSLVNREGFVPDSAYEALVDLVQTGIRLSVRVRRSVLLRIGERQRQRQEAESAAQHAAVKTSRPFPNPAHQATHPDEPAPQELEAEPGSKSDSQANERNEQDGSGGAGSTVDTRTEARSADALQPSVRPARFRRVVEEAHRAVTALRTATTPVLDAVTAEAIAAGFEVAESELVRLREVQPELRILASVGLQLGAFVHDINGMLGQSRTVKELLDPLASDPGLSRQQAARVRRVIRALDDLTHTLARQSSYLTDVLVADPRRRRSRVLVTDRLDVVRRLLADQVVRLEVTIEDALPADLKTPPMFPAEVGVMLTNLLTNAVKNAGSPGVVHITGKPLGVRGATIFIHNTGTAIDLEDAERWFLPFESTTVEVNEVLGQGLGLGLPITRALVEDYRGSIQFVQPPPDYATSIRVDLPDPQERR
ncbi:ATP-binding protein [Micromonospora antibiotica]|uniref:histidine kinase n=1 Tax=Micromonospora antibiotica TaxID=2807623 RepID=A0ABS3V806_9ACTN|nr:ATP-binding protein [Micromonospora antibiotica]MBO4161716.1 ATP-binding protein [Micromonospora antibiotica]